MAGASTLLPLALLTLTVLCIVWLARHLGRGGPGTPGHTESGTASPHRR